MKRKRNEIDDPIGALTLRLNAAFQRRSGADWLDVRRRARRLRPPLSWSRNRVLFVATVLVLAAGACAGSVGVIPWLNRHPATVKAPPLAPPCRAKDLYVHMDYSTSLNGLEGGVSLVNISRRACSLAGRPRLALVDPSVSEPRLLVEYTPPAPQSPGSISSLQPLSLLRAIPPHRGASIGFSWRNWCGPGPAPRALELRLPGGERVVLSFSAFRSPANGLPSLYNAISPRCYRERWQTGLHFGSFYPDWTPNSVISSYQLRSVLPLRTSVITKGLPTIRKKWVGSIFSNQPGAIKGRAFNFVRVKRGTPFRYRVALRNTGRRPFRFVKCPLYDEVIGNPDGRIREETFVLNCDSVGAIAPGKLAFFAMELNVPKDALLGKGFFAWTLMDGNRRRGMLQPIPIWIVP